MEWYVLFFNLYVVITFNFVVNQDFHEVGYLLPISIGALPLAISGSSVDALDFEIVPVWVRKVYYICAMAWAAVTFIRTRYLGAWEDDTYIDIPIFGTKSNILQMFQTSCWYVFVLFGKGVYIMYTRPGGLSIVSAGVVSENVTEKMRRKVTCTVTPVPAQAVKL